MYGEAPVQMGRFDLKWDEFMHYMYLPIAIDDSYVLPVRLKFAESLILKCMHEERNASWRYVYLTARRGYATPGNPLNRPGWHTDGFGTPDINYVWTDRYPTLFALGDFGEISSDHIKSISQFTDKVDDRYQDNGINVVTYSDSELLRLDSSVVHAAPEIPAPGGLRSFLKVSFSNSKYNLLGNSHNYDLNYSWKMYSRDEIRNDPVKAGADSYGS